MRAGLLWFKKQGWNFFPVSFVSQQGYVLEMVSAINGSPLANRHTTCCLEVATDDDIQCATINITKAYR